MGLCHTLPTARGKPFEKKIVHGHAGKNENRQTSDVRLLCHSRYRLGAASRCTLTGRPHGVTYLRWGPAPDLKFQRRPGRALHSLSGDTDSTNTTLRTRSVALPTRVLGCLRKNQYNFWHYIPLKVWASTTSKCGVGSDVQWAIYKNAGRWVGVVFCM